MIRVDGNRVVDALALAVIVSVAVALTYAGINVDVIIPHKLNRIATIVVPLDNGVNYLPKWRRGTVAWTSSGVTVQFDTAAPAPGLFLWIV